MRRSTGMLLASLMSFGVALPSGAATGSRGAHSFTLSRTAHAQARHGRPGFGGLGASGAYSTLLSGTFPSAPDAEEGFPEGGFPPPYAEARPPAFYLVPAVAPPQPCVKPLLIHLVQPRHTKLPRVVYGSPFTCG